MRLCSCLLIGLLAMGCAKSSLGRGLNIGVGVSATADYVTTEQGIARGAREANPLLRDQSVRWILKGAGAGAVIGAAALLESKQQRTWAHLVRVIYIAVNVGIASHNAGVLR